MDENTMEWKKKMVSELSEEISFSMDENTMKRKKKKMVAELPEEIIYNEILMRLPIKYVVRFKTVSKYWQSLLSAPKFVKQHLIRSATQNPNGHDYVIAKKYNTVYMLSRYKERYLLPADNYQLIGSINGLVCLGSGRKLALWNSAIHQYKECTLPPSRGYKFHYSMGLGYNAANDNYKAVVLSANLRSAGVYESGSDSWCDITVAHKMFSKNALEKWTPTTIVKDCLYRTCSRLSPDKKFVISLGVVKFDATTDKFKLLPEFRSNILASSENYNLTYKFADMTDHLALIVIHRSSADCMVDIYSLEGDEGCSPWIKMRSMGPIVFQQRLKCVSVLQGFKYGGEIVFYVHGVISCYDCNKTSGMVPYFDKKVVQSNN
ncbi:F-box protein At5g18160-like [Daucus carota subsp. sativus]|uniref:F-box protein At5g18160-like n=1 Tax=Daucus carota subsp. sativus TaxID=79200 RepID=UPI003082F62F